MNTNNNIKIEDLYIGGMEENGVREKRDVYLPQDIEASVYLFVEDSSATSVF